MHTYHLSLRDRAPFHVESLWELDTDVLAVVQRNLDRLTKAHPEALSGTTMGHLAFVAPCGAIYMHVLGGAFRKVDLRCVVTGIILRGDTIETLESCWTQICRDTTNYKTVLDLTERELADSPKLDDGVKTDG